MCSDGKVLFPIFTQVYAFRAYMPIPLFYGIVQKNDQRESTDQIEHSLPYYIFQSICVTLHILFLLGA